MKLSVVCLKEASRIPEMAFAKFSAGEHYDLEMLGEHIIITRKGKDEAPFSLHCSNALYWRPWVPSLHEPPDADGKRPAKR